MRTWSLSFISVMWKGAISTAMKDHITAKNKVQNTSSPWCLPFQYLACNSYFLRGGLFKIELALIDWLTCSLCTRFVTTILFACMECKISTTILYDWWKRIDIVVINQLEYLQSYVGMWGWNDTQISECIVKLVIVLGVSDSKQCHGWQAML